MLSLHSSHRQTRKSTTSYRFNPRNIETVPIKVDFCVSPEYQVSKKALEQMLNGNVTKIRIEGSLDNLDLEFHDNEFSNALKTLYPALVQEERKDADFSKGF